MGNTTLSHRIVMAPLTRYRNDDDHSPLEMMTKYYADRASVPGTLIITEATGVSKAAEAEANLPGISTPEEIAGWTKIYAAIHANKSFVYHQLWDLGRGGDPDYVKGRGYKYISSGNLPVNSTTVAPEAMTEEEIWAKIAEFRQAARNVIDAGGDGVEVHGAHGYLIDQFSQESSNNRTDSWGGSIANRSRFLLEVVKAVSEEIGAERTALRLSPFGTFQAAYTSDTWGQTLHALKSLKEQGLKLAYLSLVEPRFDPSLYGREPGPDHPRPFGDREQSLFFILEEWQNISPVIVAGGYNGETAIAALDGKYKDYNVAVAFGRPYVANPDLVYRVKHSLPFNPYNRATFFIPKSHEGYNDYPFSEEAIKDGIPVHA